MAFRAIMLAMTDRYRIIDLPKEPAGEAGAQPEPGIDGFGARPPVRTLVGYGGDGSSVPPRDEEGLPLPEPEIPEELLTRIKFVAKLSARRMPAATGAWDGIVGEFSAFDTKIRALQEALRYGPQIRHPGLEISDHDRIEFVEASIMEARCRFRNPGSKAIDRADLDDETGRVLTELGLTHHWQLESDVLLTGVLSGRVFLPDAPVDN